MSFFPGPEPDDDAAPYSRSEQYAPIQSYNQNQHFIQTPPDSARAQHHFDGLADICPTTCHGLPTAQTMPWALEQPQGLGLLAPTTYNPSWSYSSATTPQQFAMAPFTLSSTLATSQPLFQDAHRQRRLSWTESCNPQSTLLASQPWDPSEPSTNLGPSPCPSEFSTGSYRSPRRTPYTHQETHLPARASPFIKIESELTPVGPYLAPPTTQSILLSSEHSTERQGTQVGSRNAPEMLLSTTSDTEDRKPSTPSSVERAHSVSDDPEASTSRRVRRVMTRPETASCSCHICGKLFARLHNLKTHMHTHNPQRTQPHQCAFPGCEARFVRRTDLVRHDQSVSYAAVVASNKQSGTDVAQIHIKSRDFVCPRCDNSFTRKDTWRRSVQSYVLPSLHQRRLTLSRHVEDGCPNRPEVKKGGAKAHRSLRGRSRRRSSRDSGQRTRATEPTVSPADDLGSMRGS